MITQLGKALRFNNNNPKYRHSVFPSGFNDYEVVELVTVCQLNLNSSLHGIQNKSLHRLRDLWFIIKCLQYYAINFLLNI